MNGFISLHRKILDWEWYDDIVVKSVFIDLLLNASYSEHEWHGVTLKRGSCVTSLGSIASRNGISLQQVRTALKKLEKTGEINKQTTNKNTVIIICNYAKYQDIINVFEASNQQTNNKQATNNQQTNNNIQQRNKEIKEIKEQKNNIYILSRTASLYNSICKDFPKTVTEVINEARSEKIEEFKKLLGDYQMTEEKYFRKLQASDFLTGRNGRANGVFTFDWVISPDNVIAVCEGKYDNREKKQIDGNKLKSKPSYDLEKIKQNAINNTEI